MPKKVTKGVRDSWRTPQWLIDVLDKDFHFVADLAASSENAKFKHYFSEENSFLDATEFPEGVCWLNPPFSQAKKFYEKVIEHKLSVVSVYKNDNLETQVWQDLILPNCSFCFFPKGRINFVDENGVEQNQAMFPSGIFGFNVGKPESLIEMKKGFLIFR